MGLLSFLWLWTTKSVPVIIAGYGNTAGHCAAEKGHAECFNCYVQHNGSLDVLNDRNETPVQSGRRFGAPVKLQKAGEMLEWVKGILVSCLFRWVNLVYAKKYLFCAASYWLVINSNV